MKLTPSYNKRSSGRDRATVRHAEPEPVKRGPKPSTELKPRKAESNDASVKTTDA